MPNAHHRGRLIAMQSKVFMWPSLYEDFIFAIHIYRPREYVHSMELIINCFLLSLAACYSAIPFKERLYDKTMKICDILV